MAVFAAAKHRSVDGSALTNGHRGVFHKGEVSVGRSSLALAATIDIAAEFNGSLGFMCGANSSCFPSRAVADDDLGQSRMIVALGIGFLIGVAHRSQAASTKDGAFHQAANDLNQSVALGFSCRRAELMRGHVAVEATATTVNVAFVARGARNADGAAFNQHMGVLAHVSVFARAEHRTINDGILLDVHKGILHKGLVGIQCAGLAVARAEHVSTCIVVDVFATADTDFATTDGDGGQACSVLSVHGFFIGVAHRGEIAAAIHVAANAPARDADIGVAIHFTSGDAVLRVAVIVGIGGQATSTAIHIAVEFVCT